MLLCLGRYEIPGTSSATARLRLKPSSRWRADHALTFSLDHSSGAAHDLDYVELSASGSMVMLVASGTAVRIEK